MEANKYYCIVESTSGKELYILSEWNNHSLLPESDSTICKLTVYTSNMLFTSDLLTPQSINSFLSNPNFYSKLREYFNRTSDITRFDFYTSDEEDEAMISVSIPLNHNSTNYVRILETRLHRVFKDNPHLDFMKRLADYARFKETQRVLVSERVSTVASIQEVIEDTKAAVERLRQEVGLNLAGQVSFN